jgi:hypothetical protein
MTEDDFRRIEQNLAEEIRRKSCQTGAQQYDSDYYHFSDIDNIANGMIKYKKHFKKKPFRLFCLFFRTIGINVLFSKRNVNKY